MGHRTPLYEAHLAAGATLVDFGGWDMPLHYGSQVAEHQAVRSDAGMFDVSHMRPVDISGPGAEAFLRRMLANDVAKLPADRALYSCMCNERGGVVDDVIVYRTGAGFRMVVNCATTDKDLLWLRQYAADDVSIEPRTDLAIIAVQGPNAVIKAAAALHVPAAQLPRFGCMEADGVFVGRTGYTGEDGVEIMLSADRAPAAWRALREAGVVPAGLGARDTLRLEAGLNLYGNEMDEGVTPLECGLRWTVDLRDPARDFIGRAALERGHVDTRFVGLVLAERGVMRAGQRVRTAEGDGVVSSGTFSPTLGRSIAMARIPLARDSAPGDPAADRAATVEVRGRWLAAEVVDLPFVRPRRGGAT